LRVLSNGSFSNLIDTVHARRERQPPHCATERVVVEEVVAFVFCRFRNVVFSALPALSALFAAPPQQRAAHRGARGARAVAHALA